MFSRNDPTGFMTKKPIKPSLFSSNGFLYVQFTHPIHGRQKFSLKLSDDRPESEMSGSKISADQSSLNINIARGKIAEITLDCQHNRYDPSHKKYQYDPQNLIETDFINSDRSKIYISLIELWHDYCNYQLKTGNWEESTYKDYQRWTTVFTRYESFDCLNKPLEFQIDLLNNYSQEYSRRIMQQANAVCKWATLKSINKIKTNPFADLPPIKKVKGTKNLSNEPFTIPEVIEIINAFRNNIYMNWGALDLINSKNKFPQSKRKYSHSFYANYVAFMFLTGCRPEEAAAIQTKDIHKAYINIQRAYRADIKLDKKTKNEKIKRFPINAQLQEILDKQLLNCIPNSDDYLFKSITGKRFNYHQFSQRAWKTVLNGLLVDNKIRKYLPPYNCKHSFMTHALANDIHAKTLEAWTGVSANVIMSNYAGFIDNVKPPALYSIDYTQVQKKPVFEYQSL